MIAYFERFGQSKRADIAAFLLEKISDVLSTEQKENRIKNLLQEMRREGILKSEGQGPGALWKLTKTGAISKNLDHSGQE